MSKIMPVNVLLACFKCISAEVPNFRRPARLPDSAEPLFDAAADGHARNRLAGWWTDLATGEEKERNTGELLMLAISELGEVPAYPHVMEMMDDKLPDRLMVEVEIADCIIRLLDTAGARKVDFQAAIDYVAGNSDSCIFERPDYYLPKHMREMGWRDTDIALMHVVRAISMAMEGDRKKMIMAGTDGKLKVFDLGITRAIVMLFQIGKLLSLDVPQAMVDKMVFNSQREDHKRETRLAPGGKAY